MVKIGITQDGAKYCITVVGHANDEKVCAGISALYVALVETADRLNVLESHTNGADAKRAYIWRAKNIKPQIDMFRNGVRAIIREYPEQAAVL